MSMQQLMRWGHYFLRIREGYSNLWGQWGKDKCQRENPSNCQLPFLSYSPNHLLLPEVGWVGYCMEWGRYGSPNSNGRSHLFLGNMILTYGASYCPKMFPIPSCMEVVVFPQVFGSSWHSAFTFFIFLTIFFDSHELSQVARASCVYPSMILVVYLIFPMDVRLFF